MATAFRALRSDGDPLAALGSLDDYERRFPRGVLRGEARVARAEALLALGRRAEALPWLEQLEAGPGGRARPVARALTPSVRLTRAELLVEAGRCAEATHDFDVLLGGRSGSGSDTVDSVDGVTTLRALWGRASCHARVGENGRARADLERYLTLEAGRTVPLDDAHRRTVRRALEALPP